MKVELWANGFKLYGPHIIFTIHFEKTPEIYSCWANMVSSWSPILISYIHSIFIFLVKAYRLGLWIFFNSLIKFFIERKEKGVIFFIPFFFSFLKTSIQNMNKSEFLTWSQCLGPLYHRSFIFSVKAYRLGLWIFFHSSIKFFIERKEKGVIFIPFFLFKN